MFKIEGEGDNGYSDFYNTVDTILIGRRTYDWIIEEEKGEFSYKNKKCYVFSKSEVGTNENVEFIDQVVAEFTNKIKKMDGENIWLIGGNILINSFIKERLFDELIITISSILIGYGIPLFKRNDFELEFELKGIRKFNQFVELHYLLK